LNTESSFIKSTVYYVM